MFGVTLPEIHGQVHPLAVLLLHLIPAAMATETKRSHFFSRPDCNERGRGAEARFKKKKNLHEDVVLFHYLVEAVISPVNFMEPVIVNVCHHHLDRGEQRQDQPEQITSVKSCNWRLILVLQIYDVLTFSEAIPQSLDKVEHRSVTVPSLGTTTRYCEIKGKFVKAKVNKKKQKHNCSVLLKSNPKLTCVGLD